MRPPPHMRRSDGFHRASAIPWTKGKSDRTLAGLLACGSSHDARPSQASQELASGPVAATGHFGLPRYASRSPLTVAGTASDSGARAPSPRSLLSPLTGAPTRSWPPEPRETGAALREGSGAGKHRRTTRASALPCPCKVALRSCDLWHSCRKISYTDLTDADRRCSHCPGDGRRGRKLR